MSWKLNLFIVFLQILLLIESTFSTNLLKTSSGIYEGRTTNYNDVIVHQYLGIEYARINRRFERATPIVRTDERILNASTFGPFCKPTAGSCVGNINQNSRHPSCTITYGIFSAKSIPTEQCLFLNVFIPNKNKSNQKKAVFMWIHGGSGQIGTGNLFDGTIMSALGNIIVVTFNFRLNLFGFLSSGDERLEGNIGLYDQALVLDWIYENANVLGADRNQITVGGHSAGAPHAYYLAASPLNRGRIRRLILQSGSPFNIWSHLKGEDAMEKFNLVASDNGCGKQLKFHEKLTCLREKDFNTLAEQEHHSYTSANHTNVVLSGKFMSQFKQEFYRNDSLANVDLLIGATDDEGIYVAVVPIMMEQNNQDIISLQNINWANVATKFLLAMEPDKTCLHKQALKTYHLDSIPLDCSRNIQCYCSAFYNYSLLISDILFNNDYYRFLEQRVKFSKRTFIYQYSYRTSQEHPTSCNAYLRQRNLVGHFAELEYTWGTPLTFVNINDTLISTSLVKHVRQESSISNVSNIVMYTKEEEEFSKQLIERWSNFIKHGQPMSIKSNQVWPTVHNLEHASIMHFQPGRIEVKKLKIPSTVKFWSQNCFSLSREAPLISNRSALYRFSMFLLIFIELIITLMLKII